MPDGVISMPWSERAGNVAGRAFVEAAPHQFEAGVDQGFAQGGIGSNGSHAGGLASNTRRRQWEVPE